MLSRLIRSLVILSAVSAPVLAAEPSGSVLTQADEQSAPAHNYGIRISPLSLLLGVGNLGVDFRVAERLIVGPTAAYTEASVSDGVNRFSASAFSLGVRTQINLTGAAFTDSWFVAPTVEYLSATSTNKGGPRATANGAAVGATIGYHWVSDSGFSAMLAGGAKYLTASASAKADNEEIRLTTKGLHPTIDFSLGWAF